MGSMGSRGASIGAMSPPQQQQQMRGSSGMRTASDPFAQMASNGFGSMKKQANKGQGLKW